MAWPAGVSTEQWRIWEALEAGAVPVLLNSSRLGSELHPLLQLGVPIETVPDWSALPDKLRRLGAKEHAAELDARGRQLHERWADIKQRLRAHVAATLCSLGSSQDPSPELEHSLQQRQE